MSWKGLVPFYGDKTVRKRIREIEHIGVSLPVLLATSVSKMYESVVIGSQFFWNWLAAAIFVSLIYVYWDYVEKAEKKAEEIVEGK